MFFKNKAAQGYQDTIALLSRQYAPKTPHPEPLRVDFRFVLPRPQRLNRKQDPSGLVPCSVRPDRDNLQKSTQDSLIGFWFDDAQIVSGETSKFYAEKEGSARIEVVISRHETADEDEDEIVRAY